MAEAYLVLFSSCSLLSTWLCLDSVATLMKRPTCIGCTDASLASPRTSSGLELIAAALLLWISLVFSVVRGEWRHPTNLADEVILEQHNPPPIIECRVITGMFKYLCSPAPTPIPKSTLILEYGMKIWFGIVVLYNDRTTGGKSRGGCLTLQTESCVLYKVWKKSS